MADYKIMRASWFGWWGRPTTEFDGWHWHPTRERAERCAARYFRRLDRIAEQARTVETLHHDDGIVMSEDAEDRGDSDA